MQVSRTIAVLSLHRLYLGVLLLRLLLLLLVVVVCRGVRFAGLVSDAEESTVFNSVFDEAHVDLV